MGTTMNESRNGTGSARPVPDPQVLEKPQRRKFTAEYKLRVLLELDERALQDGATLEQRVGLLYGAWSLLPFVARESEAAARELRDVVRSEAGGEGVTDSMLARWAARHPPGGGRARGRRKRPGA
jgi:hypothetical protein